MAKFSGFQFHQPVLDLEGNEVMRKVMPTKAEFEAARKEGKAEIEIKEVPLTVQFALTQVLTQDLAIRNQQGQVVQPDPHEEKKFELFLVGRTVVSAPNSEEEIDISSDDIVIIKARAKRVCDVATYGFLHELLEGNNKNMRVVSPGTIQQNEA